MQKVSGFKTLPRSQVSDDLLWAANGKNNCFLRKSQGLVFSLDPTNLSGINLKRDSGVTSQEGLGITLNVQERRISEKKSKKKATVFRFDLNIRSRRSLGKAKQVVIKKAPTTNFRAYSVSKGLTTRAVIKVLRRGLKTYRPDLHNVAFKKLIALKNSKIRAKYLNKKDNKSKK